VRNSEKELTLNFLRIGAIALIFSGSLFAQATVGGCPSFPANNIWNTRVDTLPVHSYSPYYINNFTSSGTLRYDITIPINYVPGTQPKVPLDIDTWWESEPGPYPIPPTAQIEDGSDKHIIVVDKDNCILYEVFWAILQADGSWFVSSASK